MDVRIIIPAESNHIVADWLSRGFYSHLLRNGIRLLLYQGAMVHAKTATIDGQWSTIGTANIDRTEPARQLRDQYGGLQHRRGQANGGDLRRSTPPTRLSSP